MAVVNQYKFAGVDNNTSGSALTPLGSGIPAVNETIVIKSILVTSTGTLVSLLQTIVFTAIKSVQLQLIQQRIVNPTTNNRRWKNVYSAIKHIRFV